MFWIKVECVLIFAKLPQWLISFWLIFAVFFVKGTKAVLD